MDLSIIIPCYNEEQNIDGLVVGILPVVAELQQHGYPEIELILVDDGSRDATWARLNAVFGSMHWVHLVKHADNKGLGAALRTGFGVARGRIIVTTDSDATYAFSAIHGLLEHLTPDFDIVTASPYAPGGSVENVPGYRLVLSKGASTIYRLILNPHIHTYTSMFRAYRRSVLENTGFRSNDFLGVTEILVRAMLAGFSVAEYPTVLRVRKYGQSKARVARIARSHIAFQWWLVRRRLSFVPEKGPQPVIAAPGRSIVGEYS